MPDFKDKALKLQKEISLYYRFELEAPSDSAQEITMENEWGASFLYASLLEQSYLDHHFSIGRDKLNLIYSEFNKETGTGCDLDSLFSRYWLRIVNQKIQIASAIRSSIFDFEKVHELGHEYTFLAEITSKYKIKSIPEPEFQQSAKDYQKKHNVKLNLEKAERIHWLETNDKQVTIGNLLYYEVLFHNINDFRFLKRLRDILSSDERNIIISQDVLNEILFKHKVAFSLTPDLEAFIEKKVFIPQELSYKLNFRYGEISFRGQVHNKAGAILWSKLLSDASFADDIDRIRFWFDRIVYRNSWCNISKFFQPDSKERFLDAALQLLLKEKDLSPEENELMKLQLDSSYHGSGLSYIYSLRNNKLKYPTHQDLFYLYDYLSDLENLWQGELLMHQESREGLVYYIHQVVRNDSSYKYERVFALLESGIEKPFLLWKTAFVIKYWVPGIIPFLLLNKSSVALGFNLLAETRSSDGIFNNRSAIFGNIVKDCFQLLCNFLASSPQIPNTDRARIIFQCLLTYENEKFKIIGPSLENQKRHKDENCDLLISIQSIFENTPLPGTYYESYLTLKNPWFPDLLNELFENIKNYNPANNFRYNTITLPFVEIDMLIWVLKLSENSINTPEVKQAFRYPVCNYMLEVYLKSMNCGLQKAWDYESEELADKIPVWSNQQPNLELIDWKYIFLELEKEKLFDDFLSPADLKFRPAKDRYDNFNSFVSNKIRTHLAILLIGYNYLYNEKDRLLAKEFPVDTVLNKLELKISSVITLYCIDDPEKARIDIFSPLLERTFWSTEREELLPVIGTVLNKFSNGNKEKIIGELIQTDHIVRSFKLLKYLVAEKDREYLINLITESDIQKFFLSSYRNDAEYVLQKLVEEKKFEEKAKQALDIWENRKTNDLADEKNQHAIMCFRMKLLLAYHEADEEKINKIPSPHLNGGIESNRFSPGAEKDFYKALIYLHKNEPEAAYNIFDRQLKAAKEERPTLALNRFAAKLQWAEKTADIPKKKKLFQEAIDEWKTFETGLKNKYQEIDYIKDKIWYNKLHGYSGLKNSNDFDLEFNNLEKSLQLRSDFLELRIQNLVERNMQQQAESLLSEAEDYHRLNDGQVPHTILRLRSLTDTEETTKFLRNIYSRIFSKPPEQLIKILPGNLNKHETLKEFLLSEIVGSATDMLTYINSISDIKQENKFSDLMILALAGRFRNFGWHIGPARGGFPASGKANLGLIDYVLFSNKERIAICEALQLKGVNRAEVQSHNFKIFNYDPARNLFFIIVYYKGEVDTFKENWENYKTDILLNVKYPTDFELEPSSLEDISKEFGTSTVMTAKSIHADETFIYHVFININYQKAPSLLKKGK